MSEKLSFELRNWFFSLGFQEKNLTVEQIEDEFNRLSPPEMRDIWRSIMVHVVTVQKARFIRKILLFQELKKYDNELKQIKKTGLQNNFRTVEEFQRYKTVEKILKQININFKAMQNANTRIYEQKKQIIAMENKLASLSQEKESKNALQTLMNLKLRKYEETVNKLFRTYTFLDCVNSFWHVKTLNNEKNPQMEILKNILKKIHGYRKRRSNLININLKDEQQTLMNEIIIMSSTNSTSDLHKTVICMLKDTLSALLKLSDHVNAKYEAENKGQFEMKLTELKKQSVELFMENIRYKKYTNELREHTENERLKLLAMFENNSDAESQKYIETWIDSELLKLNMTSRLNFFQKKEEAIKKSCPSGINFIDEFDKEKLFLNVNNYKSQLFLLEREIANNLFHLSDEPINIFINCQHYCKNKTEEFIQIKNSSKHLDLSVKLTDSLKNEIKLLQKLTFHSRLKNILSSKVSLRKLVIPDYQFSEFIKKCSFLLYLTNLYNETLQKIDYILPEFEFLEKERSEIESEEKKFTEEIRKSIIDAKNNLQLMENYGAECLNNYQLWTKSANEIIPRQMVAADRTFAEWQRRYSRVISCLRKQQLELNKVV